MTKKDVLVTVLATVVAAVCNLAAVLCRRKKGKDSTEKNVAK